MSTVLTDTRRLIRTDGHLFAVASRRSEPQVATTTAAPRWRRELALVAFLYIAYDTTRGLRRGNITAAYGNGARILGWEHSLHLDPERTLNEILWHTPALAVLASYFYASLHFIITPAVLIWLYRRHPANYRTARTALLIGTALALVVYWLVPTAPPRLLPASGFHDILSHVHQWGWWSNEGSAPRGLGNLTNQLAAMPSLHVGWALWSGWLIARHARRRAVRLLGASYPVLTTLVVMGTGNHYLFDAIGGVLVIAIGAAVATVIARRPARAPDLTEIHATGCSTASVLPSPRSPGSPSHSSVSPRPLRHSARRSGRTFGCAARTRHAAGTSSHIGVDTSSQPGTVWLFSSCEACGERYDAVWRYCPACGRVPYDRALMASG